MDSKRLRMRGIAAIVTVSSVFALATIARPTTYRATDASVAFERSQHLLLDVRPFDFAGWKRELGFGASEGKPVAVGVAVPMKFSLH